MPKGVEHFEPKILLVPPALVFLPLMPKGVEHIAACHSAGSFRCVSSVDAERR